MSLKTVSSRENPRFKGWLALASKATARHESGQTLLDGAHLVEEALRAGVVPRQMLYGEGCPGMAAWIEKTPSIPAAVLPMTLFRQLSPVSSPSGILAVIDIPVVTVGGGYRFGMMLEDIQDPGNLGALLRCGAAAGVDAAYLSKGCAEAWSPKALRGGQGAQFRLAIHESADLAQVAGSWSGHVYAAMPHAGCSLFELDLTGPVCMAFGNEGAGLGEAICGQAVPFAIPMPGGFESLNVAAAASICLFERVRQTLAGKRSP
jgi:TrmH family RNA methyltransferase